MANYTSLLDTNKTFKNYKELCAYLGETPTTANSKKAQIKEWERYFSFRKEGQKIIITEVFDTPKDKVDNRGGNNNKNVKPFMDYLMSEFNADEYLNQYFTISNWSTLILHLLSKDVCDMTYRDDDTVFEYCGQHNILDPKLFREYVGTVKCVTKNLITTAFRGLQKQGHLKYTEGYKFRYQGEKYDKMIATDELNDYIDQMEHEICETLNNEFFCNKKIKGKQLIYILQHSKDKEKLQLYNEMRMQCMNDSNDVLCALNDAIWYEDADSRDFIDGEDKRLLNYYKAYKITDFNTGYPKSNNRQEVIDVIKRLAMKHVMSISYTTKWGEIIEPYNNDSSIEEIEKINKILFRKCNITSNTLEEIDITDYFDDEELDEIFNLDYAS